MFSQFDISSQITNNVISTFFQSVISNQITDNVISHHTTNKIKLNKKIKLTHILNINTFLTFHDQIRNSNNNLSNTEKDKSDNINENEEDKKIIKL